MSDVRRLIINADDFALTRGVNRAIAEAHGHGIVTSTTLMANGAAFDDAARLAAASPRLSIGCHVVLVDGSPLLDPAAIPSLVAATNSHHPRFRDSLGKFAATAISKRLDSSQIQAEVTAQIQKVQSAGITVSHLDTHKHTHMFPVVLHALLKAARACGIRALRNPFAPPQPLVLGHLGRRPYLWKRYFEVRVLRGFARSFRAAVENAGMVTPDGTFGILATGGLDLELFEAILDCVPDGTWEFVCHPGYNDSELEAVKTRLRASRAEELKLLTSSAAREALDRRGIELIPYRDLVRTSGT